MREMHKWKDKVELSLDNRQIFFLFFGLSVVGCFVFALGVMVGRRVEWNPEGEGISQADIALIASWNANVVRIAINQGYWLQGSVAYAPNYPQQVDQVVQWVEAAGMDVILDLHWSDRGDFSVTPTQ